MRLVFFLYQFYCLDDNTLHGMIMYVQGVETL